MALRPGPLKDLNDAVLDLIKESKVENAADIYMVLVGAAIVQGLHAGASRESLVEQFTHMLDAAIKLRPS